MMKSLSWSSLALAAIVGAAAVPCAAATAQAAPHYTLPTVPLHTEAVVEVNKKGQVVRIKSTKTCKVTSFNIQTFGNALQMWIRRPNGTAQVGLYRVSYDYDPKTHGVTRSIALVSAGGNWGDEDGAANVMIENARKQAAQDRQREEEQNAKLPSLNQIRGATPSPKPSPPSPQITLPPA
jgi:hypothetical protein